jgi:subtilisin family serine protease
MKRFAPFLVAAMLLPGAVPVLADGDGPSCTDPAVRDLYACREVVVEYDPLTIDWPGIASRYGLRLLGTVDQLDEPVAWLEAPVGTDVPALIAALALEPGVIEAERNSELVAAECRQWNVSVLELGAEARSLVFTQPALQVVAAPGGRSVAGSGVVVAVLDTGASRSHPDLRGRLVTPGIDALGLDPLADDVGNGADDDQDGATDEGWGHGTAVAGVVALAAPGARILPVRVLDDECRGSVFHIVKGMVEAVDRGARVVNVGFGALEMPSVLRKAIIYARDRGAVVVAPAGNGGGNEVQEPAEEDEAIGVAAVDDGLIAASFTDHDNKIDLSAPGVGVLAPYRASYARLDGTSFAAPFVSAAAAIGLWAEPGLGPDALARKLQDTAIDVDGRNPGLRGELGAGVPDLAAMARPHWRRSPGRAGPAGSEHDRVVQVHPGGETRSLAADAGGVAARR